MTVFKKFQYLCILSLALSLFPFSIFLLAINYLYLWLFSQRSIRHRLRRTPGFRTRNILLSGINTPQGLRLARAFYETGHNVIGLDYEPGGLPAPIRFSRAVRKFYRLRQNPNHGMITTYATSLLETVKQEHIDLWINCLSIADPSVDAEIRDTIEQTTDCNCFTLRLNNASYFTTRDKFLSYTQSLGLPVPEMRQVKSRDELHRVLNKSHGQRRYTLQDTEKEEANNSRSRMPLPKRTVSQTYNSVSRINITESTPWRLEQDMAGLQRYSTFAIIVRGEVQAFSASYFAGDSSLQLLDSNSILNKSMLRFVRSFVDSQGRRPTVHLSIDFCVEEQVTTTGMERTILPVGASVQAHVNTLLFRGIGGSVQLARAYLSCFQEDHTDEDQIISTPRQERSRLNQEVFMPESETTGVYSFGQILVQLLLEPLQNTLVMKDTPVECLRKILTLADRLLNWTDDSYSLDDPLPFWWSYQVYVPLRIIMSVIKGENAYARPSIEYQPRI